MKTAFLSYSWANEDSADLIDNLFQSIGIKVKRDKRELGYKDSIKLFMQSIRDCDYAVIMVSDESLKSQACMYEITELMKEVNFIDKILPIVVPGTKLFKAEDQIAYLSHWKNSCATLDSELRNIGIAEGMNLAEDLKIRQSIYSNISEFLKTISNRNIPPLDDMKKDNFQSLKNYLGIEKGEIEDEVLTILAASENTEETEIAIENLEKKYPKRYEVLVAKGHLEFLNKKYLKAIKSYTEVITLEPEFAKGWYNLGCMQDLNGDKEGAIVSFRKSISLGIDDSRAFNNLAGLLSDSSEKEENYLKAIELSPNDTVLKFNLGTFYANEGNNTKALEYLEGSIEAKSSNIPARMNIGLLRKNIGEFEQAIKMFESILDIDMYYSQALLQLAKTYEESELDIPMAKKYYESYLSIERDDAYEHKSYFLFLMKNYRQEEELIKKVFHYANFLEEKQDHEKNKT